MIGGTTGIRVIDLFCGGGGFSEGFSQAGFDVVLGIDNWKPACETHTINNLGECKNIDLLEVGVDEILALKKELEEKHGEIDIIIGSPPCTEFSYAKKGGKGNIEKGMLLVRKHLLFVTLFKPKYWMMENVPRLEEVLNKECDGSREKGWSIQYEKLGISRSQCIELGLQGGSLYIPEGMLFTASDFGTCENRKRFIAGDFPISLVEDNKVDPGKDVSLGGLLKRLKKNIGTNRNDGLVEDPNYLGHKVKRNEIRDYDYDTSLHPMYWEEMRHLKRRHIQYGRMHIPENPEATARTIMATLNSSSRESLIFETERKAIYQGRERTIFRQPTVREVACIQGFPLDFQLVASKLNDRYKLIGNAVPCQLSYALARSISCDIGKRMSKMNDNGFLTRVKVTLDRQRNNDNRPLIYPPKALVDEAVDIGDVHMEFKAKFTKRIRRKFLSSKLEKDSCVVIFENPDMVDGDITGGPTWKSCIQRGTGKSYHQVYLDDVSVGSILRSLSMPLDAIELRALLKRLLQDVDKGIPVLTDGWVEFPGQIDGSERYLSFITEKRLKLPSVSVFQKAFTSDIMDIGDNIGPIDLFDGLDAVMLSTFSEDRFKHLWDRTVHVRSLKDSGNYLHRKDPRIVPQLDSVEVPLITFMGGLLSVHVLHKMYENEEVSRVKGYPVSLRIAEEEIIKWCTSPTLS